METTMYSEHVMELLEKYSNDVDDTLSQLYDEIEDCNDRQKRKTLVHDYNRLAVESNTNRKFKVYRLLK